MRFNAWRQRRSLDRHGGILPCVLRQPASQSKAA